MNNLKDIKENLHHDEFLRNFFEIKEDEIDSITPEQIADVISMDCTMCLCYGCRLFTRNYERSPYKFDKKQCHDFIVSYFSRDFNPDTDLCQCPTCRKHRGEDLNYHIWMLSYKGRAYIVSERSLPEAKSRAINIGIYRPEDYPYITGVLAGQLPAAEAVGLK